MNLLVIIFTVLQSLFATLEQKTLQSDFTISIAEANGQPMTYTGSLNMHGKQFALEMLGMEAAYDGSTLYMYSDDTEELTINLIDFNEMDSLIKSKQINTQLFTSHTYTMAKMYCMEKQLSN